jgi:hypothetical protein
MSGLESFIAESFWPNPLPEAIEAAAQRANLAARELPTETGRVRLIRCVVAPTDELCSWWFEADSEEAIVAVGQAAGLAFERIGRAVGIWPPRRGSITP